MTGCLARSTESPSMLRGERTLTFDEFRMRPLCATHKKLVARLSQVLNDLPVGSSTISVAERAGKWYELCIVPAKASAASMTIYLPRECGPQDDPGRISIDLGQHSSIDLLDVHYDDPDPDMARTAEEVVRAVVNGHFCETVSVRANRPYRVRTWVGKPGKPIETDRTQFKAWLLSLGRRRSERKLAFDAYA